MNRFRENFQRAMDSFLPRRKRREEQIIPGILQGKIHASLKTGGQADSLGTIAALDGRAAFAVVADGTGQLNNGMPMSEQVVMQAVNFAAELASDESEEALKRMCRQINELVVSLRREGCCCASAVLAQADRFQWVSVGDCRIYLFREGFLNQVTRDHDGLWEQMPNVLAGEMTIAQARQRADSARLVSYFGMENLRLLDGSLEDILLYPGDRILLMTNGVYKRISEAELTEILKTVTDPQAAADEVEQRLLDSEGAGQKDYSLVILAVQ